MDRLKRRKRFEWSEKHAIRESFLDATVCGGIRSKSRDEHVVPHRVMHKMRNFWRFDKRFAGQLGEFPVIRPRLSIAVKER